MVRVFPKRLARTCSILFMVGIFWITLKRDVPSSGVGTAHGRYQPVNVSSLARGAPWQKQRDPTLVFLLSYQRSGSTYVCHLFKDDSLLHEEVETNNSNAQDAGSDTFYHMTNQTDHVFFLYEPLDALYTAMFGTSQGWNGPGAIFNHDNGSERYLTKPERKAVTWYLGKIYDCRLRELPPGILMQKFWNGFRGSMPLVDQYAMCVSNMTSLPPNKWHLENENCRSHIKKICGRSFGDKRQEQEGVCYLNLWGKQWDDESYHPNAIRYAHKEANFSQNIRGEFREYFKCMSQFTDITRKCAEEYFDRPCRAASVRAIKTVRAQMDSAKDMYDVFPNLQIIHSFRSPRALSSSRMHASWAVNPAGRKNISYIARTYCNNVFRNSMVLSSTDINRKYQIVYDDFLAHPTKCLIGVYEFLKRKIPHSVTEEFILKEQEKHQYIKRGNRWKRELKKGALNIIDRECSMLDPLINVTSWG